MFSLGLTDDVPAVDGMTMGHLCTCIYVISVFLPSYAFHEICSSICLCFSAKSSKTTIANCSSHGSNIYGLFPNNTIELYMSYNILQQFDVLKLSRSEECRLSPDDDKDERDEVAISLRHPLEGLHLLDLSHNLLETMPKTLPPSLNTLNLSFNKIRTLEAGCRQILQHLEKLILDENSLIKISNNSADLALSDYLWQSMFVPNLKILTIRRNRIESIDRNGFASLRKLNVLSLADNHLSELDDETFRGLVSLTHLDLSGNNLLQIADGTLLPFANLVYLSLQGNKLTDIPRQLPMLEWLDLSSNQIRTITEDLKSALYPVEFFNLAHNPLHCDCNLLWLKEVYDSREYILKHIKLSPAQFVPGCASPRRVATETWDLLGNEMFTCEPSDAVSSPASDKLPPASPMQATCMSAQLVVKGGAVNDSSIQIVWSFKSPSLCEKVVIHYYVFALRSTTSKHVEVGSLLERYTLTRLRHDTNYVVCVATAGGGATSGGGGVESKGGAVADISRGKDDDKNPLQLMLDHCLEVSTKSEPTRKVMSYTTICMYYLATMFATVVMVVICVIGIGVLCGLWKSRIESLQKYTYPVDEPIDTEHVYHVDAKLNCKM